MAPQRHGNIYTMPFSNLQTIPGIPLEKDELNRHELSEAYKRQIKEQAALDRTKMEIKILSKEDALIRGVKPAYINDNDLAAIIDDLLANQSPVSKAFGRHEVNKSLCLNWAKRTIKYPVNELELTNALDSLRGNINLLLMKNFDILDIKEILRSASYSAALKKLKTQQKITLLLKGKDDQLIKKEIIISDKEAEIERLKTELQRNKSEDWKTAAIRLKKSGVSVSDIAKRLTLSRGTVSTYLNKPEVIAELTGIN